MFSIAHMILKVRHKRVLASLSCVSLLACNSDTCDRVVTSSDADFVVTDARVMDVDFVELSLYPERYVGHRVRAKGWIDLGPAHTDLGMLGVELSAEQNEWLVREHHGHLRSYVVVLGTLAVHDAGIRYIYDITEITQADRPSRDH